MLEHFPHERQIRSLHHPFTMNGRDQQAMQRQFAELGYNQAEITLARGSPTSCHDLFVFYVDRDDHPPGIRTSHLHEPRNIVDRASTDDHTVGTCFEKLINILGRSNAASNLDRKSVV